MGLTNCQRSLWRKRRKMVRLPHREPYKKCLPTKLPMTSAIIVLLVPQKVINIRTLCQKQQRTQKIFMQYRAESGEGLRGQEIWSLEPLRVHFWGSRAEQPLPPLREGPPLPCTKEGVRRCSQKPTSSEANPTPAPQTAPAKARADSRLARQLNSIPLRKGRGKPSVTINLNWVRDTLSSAISCPAH